MSSKKLIEEVWEKAQEIRGRNPDVSKLKPISSNIVGENYV